MLYSPDKIKNEKGVVRTKGLFYELSYQNTSNVLFTLKDEDIVVEDNIYTSLPKLYRSMVPNDPTEYTFAITVFGYWDIWDTIRNAPQLRPHVERWRKEAEIKVKSEALKIIAEEAKGGGRSSFTAAKLLLDRGWLEKDTASKAKQKLTDKEEEEMNKAALDLLGDDAARLGLKRVN